MHSIDFNAKSYWLVESNLQYSKLIIAMQNSGQTVSNYHSVCKLISSLGTIDFGLHILLSQNIKRVASAMFQVIHNSFNIRLLLLIVRKMHMAWPILFSIIINVKCSIINLHYTKSTIRGRNIRFQYYSYSFIIMFHYINYHFLSKLLTISWTIDIGRMPDLFD